MRKLKNCPCCQGEAEYSNLKVADGQVWQIYCANCGLSTEFDESRTFCRKRWNMRLESKKAKTWITTLTSLIPFIGIVCLSAGVFIGIFITNRH